jgi:peptide-methionine (R)-S-oxide reductase
MLNRRALLIGGAAVGLFAGLRWLHGSDVQAAGPFEIDKSDSEWRRLLTKAQYEVLRLHRTEIPGSSPLNHETRAGTFACAACDLPLFSSETKYDSRTGWPSFYRPLLNAVGTSTDHILLMPRTEVHCRRCGGHLGHVFQDGPPPTGLRYCMNGVAMKFIPGPPGAA